MPTKSPKRKITETNHIRINYDAYNYNNIFVCILCVYLCVVVITGYNMYS